MIVFYLARADNGIIGRDGKLPWHLPADLKRFKAMTMGKPLIMGRKTFESFPGPLPGRRHIVLTRDRDWQADGAEVFALLRDRADRVELTEVHAAPTGDATVPDFADWRETAREDHPADGDRPAYSFVTLVRA